MINGVDSGFRVDSGVYSAPKQPRSPYPPRYFREVRTMARLRNTALAGITGQGDMGEAPEETRRDPMEIRRKRGDTRPGPREWFTGQVWMDEIATAGPPSRVRMLSVHFTPGGRTAWHHHPFGQILHVTEGEGLVQRRGGGREPIRAGDTVQAEAGEWHWHGAGPGTFMTHLAVQEADDDGQTTYWGEHVTDDEYQGA